MEGNKYFFKEDIFRIMQSEPRRLYTILVAKPEIIQRNLIGKLMKKILHERFSIVNCRMKMLTENEILLIAWAIVHNKKEENLDKTHLERIRDRLINFPCVVFCLERENAVKKMIDLIGPYNPVAARKQNQNLWRSIFGTDTVCNGLHCKFNK